MAVALLVLLLAAALVGGAVVFMTAMPGRSFGGPLPPLSADERESARRIERDVRTLAGDIGERNFRRYDELIRAAEFLEGQVAELGLAAKRRYVEVDVRPFFSIEAVVSEGAGPGDPILFGAHYDSLVGTPGADDNASGVAVALELARLLAGTESRHPIHAAFFVNEEPPHFRTPAMGSLEYARQLVDEGIRVAAMLSLESLGYYVHEPGSQVHPAPVGFLYPDRGDFVAFVGNLESRKLVRRATGAFRRGASFPSEGIAAPSSIAGVDWSDHWSFWEQGFPALMVTDTAPYRNPNYHMPSDTPDTLDFAALARITHGLRAVIVALDGDLP